MRLAAASLCLLLLTAPCLAAEPDYTHNLTGDWSGHRTALAEKGIDFQLSLIADGTKNLTGGLGTETYVIRTLVDVKLTLDLKPLVGLAGGSVFANFQSMQGPSADDRLIGDIQGIDSLDPPPGDAHGSRNQLAQLYYEQSLASDTLRIRFGKSDVNSDFDHVDPAQEFIQQSYGSSATLFTLPTYPDPSIGLSVFFNPKPDWLLQFGVFDGSLADNIPTGELGPAPYFNHPGDLFFIAEIDKSWNSDPKEKPSGLPGRAGVGTWYNTNEFARLDGGTTSGTFGPYAFVQQTLWQSQPCALSVFLMYGYADPAISPIANNYGAGISLTAPFSSRPNDIAGIGVQAAQFSDDFNATADFEIDTELFYRIQITPWFYVKPDVQYITNPGGRGVPDALAVTLRAQIDF